MQGNSKSKVSKGSRFAVSFDEYTGRNRRYMTVNVHEGPKVWYNLGMIRVWAGQTAETLLRLVTSRLEDFGITLERHVVALVTDGASIMCKVGRIAPCDHVICLAHTLHLAVSDVLYKKKRKANEEVPEEECEISFDEDVLEECESGDECDLMPDDDEGCLREAEMEGEVDSLSSTIEPAVNKIRKIVRKFRKSPVKNDQLQKSVKLKFGKELTLMLDCKTRWSSLCSMIERFLKLEPVVNEVIDELNIAKVEKLSLIETKLMNDLVRALEPFKVATEFLCRRDSDLSKSEKIVRFAISKLDGMNTHISELLSESLKRRYLDRRNKGSTLSLMKFYSDPTVMDEDSTGDFKMPSKLTIVKTSKALHGRLFPVQDPEVSSVAEKRSEGDLAAKPSLSNELENLLSKSPSQHERRVDNTFAKEVNLYMAGSEQTSSLKMIHQALMSVPPTSVEAERVFSASGLFLTKLRCQLSDITIDRLIFLRNYFKNGLNG